tara:strand:- start:803 stop:1807 length:1005 start_codon:yes stop_codon:yes gene_type:complete
MRQSRNKLCEKALRIHFNQYNVEYNLEFISNQQSNNKYFYKIIIPERLEMNKPNFNSTGEMLNITKEIEIEWEKEIILQNWPNIEDIKTNFIKNFILYEKKIENADDSCTYTRIKELQKGDFNLTILIEVVYYNHFLPFPKNTDMKTIISINDTLLEENDILKTVLNEFNHQTDLAFNHLNSRVGRLRKKLTYCKIDQEQLIYKHKNEIKNNEENYQQKDEKYQQIIQKYYKESNNKQDCPVCYEDINPDELYTPSCSHLICLNCSNRCKNTCPMCRIKYNIYDITSYEDDENYDIDQQLGNIEWPDRTHSQYSRRVINNIPLPQFDAIDHIIS